VERGSTRLAGGGAKSESASGGFAFGTMRKMTEWAS
jgi:hypothetical protein